MTGATRIDPEKLRRTKPAQETKPPPPAQVSQGPVDKIAEYILNPSEEKIREVTVVDRMQGRLLPQLDVIDKAWDYIIEVAAFRQDATKYATVFKKPSPMQPDSIKIFIYRTAQWQKSIEGKNMQSGLDLALAELESRGNELELKSGDGFGEP